MEDDEAVTAAHAEAAEIIAAAEAEAAALLEDAERRARLRAGEVIEQFQERLDGLLEQEREVRARLDAMGASTNPGARAAVPPESELTDSRDAVNGIEVEMDSSLADFMKSTLRHEVRPD